MSRSLNRIRSLVSEIEQIQKRGQLSSATSVSRSAIVERQTPDQEGLVESAEEVKITPTEPILRLAPPTGSNAVAEKKGRVAVQLSGAVVLELQIEDSHERLELKQVGDAIEIRFQDGKAFHIPFKAVA